MAQGTHLSPGLRVVIGLQAVGATVAVLSCSVLVEWALTPLPASLYPLRLAVAFGLTQLVAATYIAASVLLSKGRTRAAARRTAVELPAIRQALNAYAVHQTGWEELRRRFLRHPTTFRHAFFDLVSMTEGEPRAHLVEAAMRLGLVSTWIRLARFKVVGTRLHGIRALGFASTAETRQVLRDCLRDPIEEVRVAAAESLLRQGNPTDVFEIFQRATRHWSSWSRAVLGEALRAHAPRLAHGAIPRALADGSPAQIVAVLNLAALWEITLPVPETVALTHHPEPRVRALALRALPQTDDPTQLEGVLRQGLGDEMASVRLAAATAVGRLRVQALAPDLMGCLSDAGDGVKLAAAAALAELAPRYVDMLEVVATRGQERAARVAAEIIEKCRIGRLRFATR